MYLAIKEMKKEKGRFFLIISIFVLISYLVFFLVGLANGLAVDNRTAVDQWQATDILLADGSNKSISSSMLDQETLETDLNGIDYELINLSRSATYINGSEKDENTINIALIGMDPESDVFPEVLEGTILEEEGQAVASLALRDEEGLEIGDELKLSMNGAVFEIVAFTDDYKYNVSPVIYTQLEEASAASLISPVSDGEEAADNPLPLPNHSDRVSAALLRVEEGDRVVLDDLNEDYDVIPIDSFIEEIPGYSAQILTFGLMIGFLIAIASLVLGVFLYIITIQKKEVFGIMKIQGISNPYISKSVILQTFLVSLLGLGIGLALTYLTEYFLPASVPFKSNLTYYLIITGLMVLTAQIGAIFSVRSVASIDPLEVI